MATYEELKKLTLKETQPGALNRRNAAQIEGVQDLDASAAECSRVQDLGPHARDLARKQAVMWHNFMLTSVTDGIDLPSDVYTSPVVFNTDRTMFSSIGGGVILVGDDMLECTATPMRVSISAPDAGWVAVKVKGEIVAMSVDEAFRRGLREVALPQ
jgi:hypothetical protein